MNQQGGFTYIYIDVGNETKALAFSAWVYGTVTIDWGDNSATETVTDTGVNDAIVVPHTYANAGEYCIKLKVTSGSMKFAGDSSQQVSTIIRGQTDIAPIYAQTIKKVFIGNLTYVSNQAFAHCHSLEAVILNCYEPASQSYKNLSANTFYYSASLKCVVLPQYIIGFGGFVFGYSGIKKISLNKVLNSTAFTNIFISCLSLKRIAMPPEANWSSNYAFRYDYGLTRIALPKSVTTTGSYGFGNCSSLVEIKLPSGITTVSMNSFLNCSSLLIVDFSNNATVPTLSNVNAFSGVNANCKIIVPDDLYDTWKTTGNWSNSAVVDKITKASQA